MCLGLNEKKSGSVSLIDGHIDPAGEPEELFIKSEVKNPILKEFLNRLEKEYGCLITNSGTLVKVGDSYKWLSVKSITIMVSELDKELRE